MLRILDILSSYAATIVRFGRGLRVGAIGKRPEVPLILYEFESCPHCRRVREAMTQLDLQVEIRPCPKRGQRFREELIERGGRAQFPYFIDPNTGEEMYESSDIITYLYQVYGGGPAPLARGLLAIPSILTGTLASVLRFLKGTMVAPSKRPEEPLELWSFEASPHCRIVRERLCVLELPYLLHNVGFGSTNRSLLADRAGEVQIPFLIDPNTGVDLFESEEIVAYLDRSYLA